jgi:hypothetical protein
LKRNMDPPLDPYTISFSNHASFAENMDTVLDLGTGKVPSYIVPLCLTSTFLYYKFVKRPNAHRPPWHPARRSTTLIAKLLSIFYLATFATTSISMIRHPTWPQPLFGLSIAHIFALTVLETWLDRTDMIPRAFAAAGWMNVLYLCFNPSELVRTLVTVVLSLPAALQMGENDDQGLGLSGALLLIVGLRDALPKRVNRLGYWVPVPLVLVISFQAVDRRLGMSSRLRNTRRNVLREVAYAFLMLELMAVGWAVSSFACWCLDWHWLLFGDGDKRATPGLHALPFLLGWLPFMSICLLVIELRQRQGDDVPPAGDWEARARSFFPNICEATGWTIVFWQFLWWILLGSNVYGAWQ